MPLCELRIPNNQCSNQSREGWIRTCDLALDDTLNGLEIPDPSDREYRISALSEIEEKEIVISFTCGRDEYGVGEIFDPSTEKMQGTVKKIFEECSSSGISRVTMEKWKGTSFAILKKGNLEEGKYEVPDKFRDGVNIYGKIKLVLSPRMLESCGGGNNKEKQTGVYLREFQLLGNRMTEVLGGNESFSIIQLAEEAEADIGVEVDLGEVNEPFSNGEMDFLRDRIGEVVIESGLMFRNGEKNVTLWIRQKNPEHCVAK